MSEYLHFDLSSAVAILEDRNDIAALVALRESLASCGEPGWLRQLAQALPQSLGDVPAEISLELSRLAMELAPYSPVMAADVTSLAPRLRVSWLRSYVCAGYDISLLSERVLLQVVVGWDPSALLSPGPLLERLVGAKDARLRSLSLDMIPNAVESLRLETGKAFSHIRAHCEDSESSIRKRALPTLSAPWLSGLRPADSRDRDRLLERALRDDCEGVAKSAVAVACDLGCHKEVREALLDTNTALSTRIELMTGLGSLAENEDLDSVVSLALEEPLAYGAAARNFILEAHRRGVFIRQEHMRPLLQLFDGHSEWTGEEFVRVSYLERNPLVAMLEELDANDTAWCRRSQILSASYGVNAHRLIGRLLEACTDPTIATYFVRAAGASAEFFGEKFLLRWLERLPEEVIPVLRVKGQSLARVALRAIIDDPLTPTTLRTMALEALWSQHEDRAVLLHDLCKKLGPSDSGLLDSGRSATRDSTVALLIAQAPWKEEKAHQVDPHQRLQVLCESSNPQLRPEIISQFRLLFRDYVAKALQGDFTIKRVMLPELEQMLFRHGRHLVADGRCVRSWMEESPETGRDFVVSVALEWLGEEPTDAITVALLELLARHAPSGAELRAIEPYWRHSHKGVQRAGIEAILASGEGARGLELSICRLAQSGDPRILCQALEGVASLGATWAQALVVTSLERKEMSVKKAAADALAVIGRAAAVPAIVYWLGRHDNSGFRTSLKAALRTSAGSSANAVLISACEEKDSDTRRTELLWDALSGQLPLAVVLSLAATDSSPRQALVEACLVGTVQLADGSQNKLAARLHRADLRKHKKKDDPARELRVHGFSKEAALHLVEARSDKTEAQVLAIVRSGMAEWLAWLAEAKEPHVGGSNLVLAAATATHTEHFDAFFECIGRLGTKVDAASLVGLIERCRLSPTFDAGHRLRSIALLRTTPTDPAVGGLRRYRLLGQLGALRTLDDLFSALDQCRLRPDYAGESTTLLIEALQIPAKTKNESYDVTSLRNEAEHWCHTPDANREAWLATMVEERPLDLPLAKELEPIRKSSFGPCLPAHREQLLARLHADEQQERNRAAKVLMNWPDGKAHSEVLAAFLAGRVEVDAQGQQKLARRLQHWPTDSTERQAANGLRVFLTRLQIRSFLPSWTQDWRNGKTDLDPIFSFWPVQEELMPLLRERLKDNDYSLLALLSPGHSLAHRTLIARLEKLAPSKIARLQTGPEETEVVLEEPIDPLAGKTLKDLVTLLQDTDVAHGLAVRAIHALAAHGEPALPALDALVTDPRTKIRSAALRALRTVASKDQSFSATLRVLKMETRRDIVLRLMSSLGHARYEPALGALLDRLTNSDYRIRQGAHAALRAWGESAVPAIEHASRKARPDRRHAYTAVIADLEA